MHILNVYEIDFPLPSWFVWALLAVILDKIGEKRIFFFFSLKNLWVVKHLPVCVSKKGRGKKAGSFGWPNSSWLSFEKCLVSFEPLEMFFLYYIIRRLRLNDTVSIIVTERCQQAESVFVCLAVQLVQLPSLELNCSVCVCFGKGRKYIPGNNHFRESWK